MLADNASKPWPRWVTLAVVLLAAAVRLYNLNWDQSHHFHPDERAIADAIGKIRLDPRNPQLDPQFFAYGSLPFYLVRAVADAGSVLFYDGRGVPYHHMLILGRGAMAVLGTITVWLLITFGSRIYDRRVGMLAAFLLAMCPLHIQNSHYMTTDVGLTLAVLFALWSFVAIVRHGRWRDYVLAGIAMGAAVATKFSAMPILAPFGVAILLRLAGDRRIGRAFLGGTLAVLVGIVAFAIGEPYAFKTFNPFTILGALFGALGSVFSQGLNAFDGFVRTVFWDRYVDSIAEQGRMVRNPGLMPYTNQYIGTPKYLYELEQIVLWCMAPPLGIAVVLGTIRAFGQLLRERWREHAILLAYVIPYFAITGWFGVKFPRYLLPIYPIVILWAAGWLWEISRRSRVGRLALWTVVIGTTAAALALLSVYQRPHTIVTASEWLYEHVPKGSKLLSQHWDEGFPFGLPDGRHPGRYGYRIDEVGYYEPDTHAKVMKMARQVAEADYIIFQTKRLYGAITMAPQKFPYTNNYFYLLFAGDLGYKLIYDHDARPRLFGIEFPDELADESLTVYDHPKVLIFQNVGRLSAEEISGKILRSTPSRKLTRNDLLLAKAETASTLGGEEMLLRRSSWSALLWFAAAVQLLGLALFPIVHRWLPVPGSYAIAKIAGILVFSYLSWLLVSLGFASLSRDTLMLVFVTVLGAGWLARRRWEERPERMEWWPVELVFWTTFGFFLLIRAYNPEVYWGEKPMDFSFLNTIYRTTTLPPPEPWFAGSTLCYSYFGHYIVGALGKLCHVHPGLAFNLGIALFGALTATGAFAAGCAIADRWRVGLLATFFVTLCGNLAGIREAIARGNFGFDYFWATSRVIKDSINEYPLWSFLFADLHAHVLVMPFSLLFITLTLWWTRRNEPTVDFRRLPLLVLLSLTLGTIMVTNTWSSFTYLPFFPFALACVWLAETRASALRVVLFAIALVLLLPVQDAQRLVPQLRGFLEVLQEPTIHYTRYAGAVLLAVLSLPRVVLTTGTVGTLAWLFYWPYWKAFKAPDRNFGLEGDAFAHFYDFANIFGLFLFVAVPFLFIVWRKQLLRPEEERLDRLSKGVMWLVGASIVAALLLTIPYGRLLEGNNLRQFLHIGWFNNYRPTNPDAVIQSVRTGLTLLAVLAFCVSIQGRLTAVQRRIALLFSFAFFVTAGVDVLHIWDRMNTVFKFYLEAWFLFGTAAAAATVEIWNGLIRSRLWRHLWQGGLFALVAVALFTAGTVTHGVLVTNRVATPKPTLDGTAYLAKRDPHEAAAFDWLNREVGGIPVIAEAWGPSYQEYTRVSMNTGLPTVVGWEYHLSQRCQHPVAISQRKEDIRKLYTSENKKLVGDILDKYKIALVYVGPLERRTYSGANLKNFREWPDLFSTLYQNAGVTIFGVLGRFAGATPITTIEEVPQDIQEAEVPAQDAPGQFRQPRGIGVDKDGFAYVADFGNHRIQKFDPDLEFIAAWGEQGNLPGQFKEPCEVAVGPDGLLYVADTWNGRIQVLTTEGEYVREFGESLFGPRGIAVSADGKVYLADTGNHRIRRYNLEGTEELSWGGNGSADGQFKEPYGVTVDAEGRVYVCDNGNGRLQIFDANGKFLSSFPVEGWVPVVYSEPKVTLTPDGTIWVTVPERRVVRNYDRSGKMLREIRGTEFPMGQFDKPMGITYTPLTHELFLTDLEHRLARIPLPIETKPALPKTPKALEPKKKASGDKRRAARPAAKQER